MAAAGLASAASAETTYRDNALDNGGWVSGFAQHSSGRLYGYGDIFGLYRSDDFGASWRFLQAGLTDPGNITFVSGVTVHPLDANRVAFMAAARVWTSADGGETWTTRLTDINKTTLDRGTKPIAYHPTQPNELWLAANRSGQSSSLWRSTDNGVSWSAIGGTAFAHERATGIHIYPAAPEQIWAVTEAITRLSTLGGLWCSADAGTTWTKVWNNGGAQTEYYGAPGVNSIARNSAGVSVFSSNDGVWQVTATDLNTPATYTATQRTWNGQSIPNVTALSNGSFWASEIGDQPWAPKVSTDGITWTDRQITHTSSYVPEWATASQIITANRVYGRDMMVQDVSNSSRLLVTGGASAHLSEDNGLTWRYQPGGMAGIASHRVNFDRVNPLRAYIATADRGIFIVNDGGLSGKSSSCSRKAFDELHNFHEAMVSADGQTIVGAGVHQGLNQTVIIRSTDDGASWLKLAPAGLPASYEGITRAVMSLNDPNDYLVILGYTHKVGQANNPGPYRTIDGGANLTKVGGTSFDGINTGQRYAAKLARLERGGVNPNTRYLCLRANNNSPVRGVWRSTDGGTTWLLRTDPFNGAWTWALAVDPTVEGRLWAGAHSLRSSDDGGGTWTTASNFVDIDSLDSNAGRLTVLGRRYGDTFNKIYASADNGIKWQEMSGSTNRLLWANREISLDPWRSTQIWVTGSRSVQLINPPTPNAPPVIASGQSASGTVGTPFSYPIQSSNSPTSYTLASGTLPAGVTLNGTTGLLSGTPTQIGTFTPTVTTTNGGGTSPAVTIILTIVAPPTGLQVFRSAHSLSADGSQDVHTPAGDGVANLIKYAFNMLGVGIGQAGSLTSPNTSVVASGGFAGLPLVDADGSGKLRITYIRCKATANSGISYAVEFSNALASSAVNPAATEGPRASIPSMSASPSPIPLSPVADSPA